MLNTFKNWFGYNQKEKYVWLILPEQYQLRVISQNQYIWLYKQKNLNFVDNLTLNGPIKTISTKSMFKVDYTFENGVYGETCKNTTKFEIIEFKCRNYYFNNEHAIIRVCKDFNTSQYFELNLYKEEFKILLFSDFVYGNTENFHFLEKQIIIIRASFVFPKMIQYIIQKFKKSINLYIKEKKDCKSF